MMHAWLVSFKETIRFVNRYILFYIFEPLCAGCKRYIQSTTDPLCSSCHRAIKPVVSVTYQLTATKNITVYAAGAYEGPLQVMILAKRYHDIAMSLALAEIIKQYTPISSMGFDALVPIPLHWTRRAARGYNQAEEIAYYLSKALQIPVVHLLARTRKTQLQLELDATERATNLKDAFTIAKPSFSKSYQKKRLLLVDDLLTTGSTLTEAAKVLYTLNPIEVKAVVGARTI